MHVELSDSTFHRLQGYAQPFVDNKPEDVIVKLADFFDLHQTHDGGPGQKQRIEIIDNDAGIPPTASLMGRELRGFQRVLWERVIALIPFPEFTLRDVYAREAPLAEAYPRIQELRASIRAALQKLRDKGYIKFINNYGNYRRVKGHGKGGNEIIDSGPVDEGSEDLTDVADYIVPNEPLDLRFTKIIDARFDNKPTKSWNEGVRLAVKVAIEQNVTIDELVDRLSIPIQNGLHNNHGFHPIQELGISVQNTDATTAWRQIERIARRLKVEVVILFEWRDKEDADHPGAKGKLMWKPSAE